jgi:hypothetical protein
MKPIEKIEKTVYHDNFFDRLFIEIFVRKIATTLGQKTDLKGYESFVDLSKQIVQGRSAQEQQQVIALVLKSLLPAPVLTLIRTWFPPVQWVCELNAWSATLFSAWLVGPSKVIESEIVQSTGEMRKQWSGVHIEKCRFLESSGCVGMCVNLCKLPTQAFFTEEFGIPLTMTPNFEDLSCDMVFGQMPPPLEQEPIYQQSCLVSQCSLPESKAKACPQVERRSPFVRRTDSANAQRLRREIGPRPSTISQAP